MQLQLYNIDYYALKLHVLETFECGEFVLGQKIKVIRKFVNDPSDTGMFSHHTEIFDQTLAE